MKNDKKWLKSVLFSSFSSAFKDKRYKLMLHCLFISLFKKILISKRLFYMKNYVLTIKHRRRWWSYIIFITRKIHSKWSIRHLNINWTTQKQNTRNSSSLFTPNLLLSTSLRSQKKIIFYTFTFLSVTCNQNR